MNPGPSLELLTRRLMETPPEFRAAVACGDADGIILPAVVGELLQRLGMAELPLAQLRTLRPSVATATAQNRLQLILIACWLLADPWFAARPQLCSSALNWLLSGLDEVAAITPAQRFIDDDDRREELARLCLQALGLQPEGETNNAAHDRLVALSSVERRRVMEVARVAEERAQKVREEMERKAAEAAAAKGARE